MAPGTGAAAIQWTLNYPAAGVAQIVAVAGPAASAANKTLTCAGNRCVLWGLDAQTVQSGVVAVVTVEFAGASGAVAFQLTEALAASPLADPIPISTVNAPLVMATQPPVFPRGIAAGLGFTASVAQVALAGGWDTTINLINTGTGPADARTQFFGDNGDALSALLRLPQSQDPAAWLAASSLDQTLAPSATLAINSAGPDSQPPQAGSAQLSTAGSVGGFIRFRHTSRFDQTSMDREAAFPLETRNASSYFLACDNTNGASTGVSIANVTAVPADILVVIRDDSGMQIDSGSISLPANGHIAFVASEQFTNVANRRITMEFDTPVGGQISILGMRFPLGGGFTTIPAASSNDTGNGSMAHLAVGGGWTTSIQLINLGNATVQAHLRFFDDNGLALTLPVTASGGATASVDPWLPPHSTIAIESTGADESPVQSGSVHVTSDGQVTGFVRFRYAPLYQEAMAPLETRNPGSYILAFDNTDGLATGVAVANVASTAGAIPVIIRDATGAQIGSETITIPGDGHSAFALSDRFPATVNQRGTLEFLTPPGGQVSVLGMRFLPSGAFSIIPVVVP